MKYLHHIRLHDSLLLSDLLTKGVFTSLHPGLAHANKALTTGFYIFKGTIYAFILSGPAPSMFVSVKKIRYIIIPHVQCQPVRALLTIMFESLLCCS